MRIGSVVPVKYSHDLTEQYFRDIIKMLCIAFYHTTTTTTQKFRSICRVPTINHTNHHRYRVCIVQAV